MITVELEGREWNMPAGWNEVSIEMFEKIVKQSSMLNDYKSQTQFAIEMFHVLTGAPIEDLNKMTRAGFETLSKYTEWVNTEIKGTKRKTWVFDGIEYMAIEDLNALTMGESVSMELIINDSTSEELLTNLLPVLIRKVKKIQKTNGKVKKVPDAFDANEYNELKELFRKNLMVADVFELKSFF
jgi:hypothetical protein